MNDIKQLEERIAQLTELVKTGSEAIKSMETALKAAEEERDRLADQQREQEPKFERVKEGEEYYFIDFDVFKSLLVFRETEGGYTIDEAAYEKNDYFKTKERAKEVADKINFLLKLERLHDVYCPEYVPDWNDNGTIKYMLWYDTISKRYGVDTTYNYDKCVDVYFSSEEIAQKVCDILNKELEEKI